MNACTTGTGSHRHSVSLGVALVHLVSGEDVIAAVAYDAENRLYPLHRPATPIVQPVSDPTGQPVCASIGLVPYLSFLDPDEPLLIREVNVLFIGKLAEKVEQQYSVLTGC